MNQVKVQKIKDNGQRTSELEIVQLDHCRSGHLVKGINEAFIYPLDTVSITPMILSFFLHPFSSLHFLTPNHFYFLMHFNIINSFSLTATIHSAYP